MGSPGRISEYTAELCEQIIDHGAEGLSIEAFAGKLRVSRTTIYNWQKAHPDFKDACEISSAACLYFWEVMGRDGMQAKEIHDPHTGVTTYISPVVPAMWIFNMKARHRWSDGANQFTGDKDNVIQLKYAVSDEPPQHPTLRIVEPLKVANE